MGRALSEPIFAMAAIPELHLPAVFVEHVVTIPAAWAKYRAVDWEYRQHGELTGLHSRAGTHTDGRLRPCMVSWRSVVNFLVTRRFRVML